MSGSVRTTSLHALVFLFASLACAQPNAEEACARATALHRAGNIQEAVPAYQACVAAHPDVPALRSDFGAALARLGRYEEAIRQYREALSRAPGNPAVRRNLALAYYKSGELAKAAEELQSLHTEGPQDRQIALLLADCHLQMGEFQRVIDLLAPIEPQHREDRAFAYVLGTALIRSGQVSRGQAMVDGILRDGESAEARFLLGTAAFMQQDYPRAVEEFAKAVELNPGLPSLHSFYGQALLLTGDADGADAAFRSELATNPNDFESNLRLGEILAQRKHPADAVPFLAHAAQVRPGSFEARRELGAAYLAAGQPEKARHELETAARAQPDVASVHADLAKAYEQLRRPEDVRREREVAAKLSAAAKPDAHDTDLLRPGSMAPDFTLRRKGGNGEVHLAELLGSRPVVLMFGSYTCPKFRFDAPTLNALYERYRAGVEFLMIYVQEAHTGESWESSVNQRERIQLPAPKSLEQKEQNAATCARRLEIRFPMAVDGMDRKVERAYAGWPSAVYILDKDGRIAWRSRLGEVELPADELERAIQQSAAHTAKQQ